MYIYRAAKRAATAAAPAPTTEAAMRPAPDSLSVLVFEPEAVDVPFVPAGATVEPLGQVPFVLVEEREAVE